jgi:hypothetical protein
MSALLFAATRVSLVILCSAQPQFQDAASFASMPNHSAEQVPWMMPMDDGAYRGTHADCCDSALVDYMKSYRLARFSFAIGNAEGPCCVINRGLSSSQGIRVWSASKWVTGYMILRLIDDGKLSLDDPAAKVLKWWTTDKNDMRSTVTIRHLLSQTAGLETYRLGLAMCTKDSTITCAKDAYENLFGAAPGEKFTYTESSFYVLAAVAMEITGLSNVDSVFQKLIARPLEMEGCSFSVWSLQKTDPGGGLICSAEEYGKFMRAVFGQTLVSKKLHEEAERFQTELASNMPQWFPLAGEGTFHYALGSWRDAKIDGVLMHSMGAEGFYPYIWRKGRESHWGVFATQGMGVGIAVASIVMNDAFPLARKAMENIQNTPIGDASPMISACERFALRAKVAVLTAVASVLLRVV